MMVFWVIPLLIYFGYFLISKQKDVNAKEQGNPVDILKMRYAKGEIKEEGYNIVLKKLKE